MNGLPARIAISAVRSDPVTVFRCGDVVRVVLQLNGAPTLNFICNFWFFFFSRFFVWMLLVIAWFCALLLLLTSHLTFI